MKTKKRGKQRILTNKERKEHIYLSIHKYYVKNKKKIIAKQKIYSNSHKEKRAIWAKTYRKKHHKQILLHKKEYRATHQKEILISHNLYNMREQRAWSRFLLKNPVYTPNRWIRFRKEQKEKREKQSKK